MCLFSIKLETKVQKKLYQEAIQMDFRKKGCKENDFFAS
jgi:hypothetical protein